jgi:hypothetical protein
MNLHELGILIVHTLKAQTGTEVALLVRKDTRRPESWCKAGPNGSRRAETACVRVMQAQAQAGFAPADYYLYTTEPPTPMDLGMGVRCHVSAAFFLHGAEIRYNAPQDVNAGPRVLTQEMKEMIAGLWAAGDEWKQVEANFAKHRVPGVAATVHANVAQAWRLWLGALSRIPEVGMVWLTLPHRAELKHVPAPRFVAVPVLCQAHGKPATAMRDRIYMTLTFALLHAAHNGANAGRDALNGQEIAALLVGPGGRLLSWGVNTNDTNVTRHGETNCIQAYFMKADADVPDGSTLYTTLQSCEMCAGMLATV